MKAVKFNGWNGEVEFGTYNNGRTAITLNDVEDGQPIATATVNIPDEPIEKNEVHIKNYSENQGITESLVEAGIINKPHRKFQQGFVQIEVCNLIDN